MNKKNNNLVSVLQNKIVYIFLFAVLLAVMALVITLLQTPKYRVKTSYLIVQKQENAVDAYATARSSEKVAMNFSRIIATDSFFNKVLSTTFGVQEGWPEDPLQKRKMWNKTIKTVVTGEDSILTVEVYHENSKTAREISKGIAFVLVNQSSEYHGAGDLISIKIVDSPLDSKRPVKPNYLVNILGAFLIGLFSAGGFFVYRLQFQGEENFHDLEIAAMHDQEFDQAYFQEEEK